MPRKTSERPLSAQKRMVQDLQRSGLTAQDATSLKLRTLDEKQTLVHTETIGVASYRIPYFDINGRPTRYHRLRFLDVYMPSGSKKPLRYWQPGGSIPSLYIPPLLDWRKVARDEEAPIYITEGEKKAAKACKEGLPCIGIGGVWAWRAAKKGVTLIDDFKQFNWKGRRVVIVFDSDVHEKQEVQAALTTLAKELITMGASPYTIKLPSADGEKVGLDDFLVNKSVEAFLSLPQDQLLGELGEQLWALNEELAYIEESEGFLRIKTGALINRQTLVNTTYANKLVTIVANDKAKHVSVADEWVKWPHRRTHTRVTYAPGMSEITDNNEYNMWPGWGVEPKKGDLGPWLRLIEFLFRGAPQHQQWFLQWLAYPIQNPGVKMYTAAVLYSLAEGMGKSLVGVTMGQIYGKNFSSIDQDSLHKSFNEWGANKQFVLGDDVTGSDRKADAGILRAMVTREVMTVNKKYQPEYTVPDRINYMFTTNLPDAFFLARTDRRYFVLEIKGDPLPLAFYKEYDDWLWRGGGPSALFYALLNGVDCSKFNPKAPAPITEAKQAMIEISRSDVDNWAIDLRNHPESVLRMDGKEVKRVFWTANELLILYDPLGQKKSNVIALSKALRRAGFAPPQVTKLPNDLVLKLWAIRDIEKWNSADHHQRVQQYLKERPTTEAQKKGAKF